MTNRVRTRIVLVQNKARSDFWLFEVVGVKNERYYSTEGEERCVLILWACHRKVRLLVFCPPTPLSNEILCIGEKPPNCSEYYCHENYCATSSCLVICRFEIVLVSIEYAVTLFFQSDGRISSGDSKLYLELATSSKQKRHRQDSNLRGINPIDF